MSTALVSHTGAPLQQSEREPPDGLLAAAVRQGATPEVLERLLALQERHEARLAQRAHTAALVAARAQIPATLPRSRQAHGFRYVPLEDLLAAVTPPLTAHGIGLSWSVAQTDATIAVTCRLTHSAGHSSETTIRSKTWSLPAARKAQSAQEVGATVEALKRYTLACALGIGSHEDDGARDGAGARPARSEPRENASKAEATPEQRARLQTIVTWATAVDRADIARACTEAIDSGRLTHGYAGAMIERAKRALAVTSEELDAGPQPRTEACEHPDARRTQDGTACDACGEVLEAGSRG